MDEARFWLLIEDAWKEVNDLSSEERCRRVREADSPDEERRLHEELGAMVAALTRTLEQLPADDLLAFDRILERKLYQIDREEIHEYTDGSDDGFLYARGYIVAMGERYYTEVDADPSKAQSDCECEEMCYLSCHIYEERFGDMPGSGVSRESCSNREGWPSQ